jgi:hypothetical protein
LKKLKNISSQFSQDRSSHSRSYNQAFAQCTFWHLCSVSSLRQGLGSLSLEEQDTLLSMGQFTFQWALTQWAVILHRSFKHIYKQNPHLNLILLFLCSFCPSVEKCLFCYKQRLYKKNICVLAIFKLKLHDLPLPLPWERPPSKPHH